MTEIKIYRELEIRLTAQEVAELFCNMDNIEQAIFFNHVAEISDKWNEGKNGFELQMSGVSTKAGLEDSGRKVMKIIGEFSEKQ